MYEFSPRITNTEKHQLLFGVINAFLSMDDDLLWARALAANWPEIDYSRSARVVSRASRVAVGSRSCRSPRARRSFAVDSPLATLHHTHCPSLIGYLHACT